MPGPGRGPKFISYCIYFHNNPYPPVLSISGTAFSGWLVQLGTKLAQLLNAGQWKAGATHSFAGRMAALSAGPQKTAFES